jgi:hypothetical protein
MTACYYTQMLTADCAVASRGNDCQSNWWLACRWGSSSVKQAGKVANHLYTPSRTHSINGSFCSELRVGREGEGESACCRAVVWVPMSSRPLRFHPLIDGSWMLLYSVNMSCALYLAVQIVHCCGYDSVPFDLGVLLLADHARKHLNK